MSGGVGLGLGQEIQMKKRRSNRGWSRTGAIRIGSGGLLAAAVTVLLSVVYIASAALPPVPQPAANPITEPKRVLGKILFFEEQISSNNAVACATCHVMSRAGADPRLARNPGPDTLLNTPDDRIASPGVIRSSELDDYIRDAVFGFAPQVTDRTANSPINSGYVPQLFWDGRASGQFIDPETGQVVIAAGGALESQSVDPPLSTVEMAHEGFNWGHIVAKLQGVRPLDLATNLPPDVAAALEGSPDYPELFRRAFGTSAISAQRIAFALATYQRTLIADDTPWDRFQAGQAGALTQGQTMGLQIFQQNCAVCHAPPFFSDHTFRNVGLRPSAEDPGRQLVTGSPADRGRFKVPGLRNVGLKPTFMHNGQFTTLQQVARFYARAPGAAPQFPDNRDPAMLAINFPAQAEPALIDFLANALLDQRVAMQQFPFDRPTLFSERANHRPTTIGSGIAGSGGIIPQIIASDPPRTGNAEFRIGLHGALGGASARLGLSDQPPVGGRITPQRFVGTLPATGSGVGQGYATLHWPLDPGEFSDGQIVFVQWFVQDGGAAGGEALSPVARLPMFCGREGCAPVCYANCDGSTLEPVLNVDDFLCFINRYATAQGLPHEQQVGHYANCDRSTLAPVLNVDDFTCFLNHFAQGCR
jgi:cytochrome c peroxidase